MTRDEFLKWMREVAGIYERLPEKKKEKLMKMTDYFDAAPDDKKRGIANQILLTVRRW